MTAAARRAWGGRPTWPGGPPVSTNKAAAELVAAVRENLVALGLVEPAGVPLDHADGGGTVAGVGDRSRPGTTLAG